MKERVDFTFIKKRITLIATFFTVSLVTILALTYVMFGLLSATRAFTGYHSLWSHTQNQALIHLISYTHSGEISEYDLFGENLAVMDGIQNALYELNMDEYNYAVAEQNFQKTSLYINQIEEKIKYLHFLRNFSAFKNALNKWEDYHQNSEHLRDIAKRAKTQIENGEMDEFSRNQILFLAQNLNTILVEDQIELLNDMNEASENLAFYSFSLLLILTIAVSIIFGGLIMNWQKSLNLLKNVSEERDRIASFPKMNPNPIVVMNKTGSISYTNSAAASLFGINNATNTDNKLSQKLLHYCTKLSASSENTIVAETKFKGSYYLLNGFLIEGKKAAHFYFIDITDRKRLENELQKSLSEKTILLSEVHHRVKNNLAIAIGFLEIEKNNLPTHIRKSNLFQRSISRLHSIATIHNLLYEQKEFSKIPLFVFLKTITETIKHQFTDTKIHTEFSSSEVESQQININQALPCGMLINEIVAGVHASESEINIRADLSGEMVHICFMSATDNLFSFIDSESDNTIVNILFQQLQANSLTTDDKQKSLHLSFKIRDLRGSGSALL
jgi:two-component sensor histidine kinase/PAS domain-containing protein